MTNVEQESLSAQKSNAWVSRKKAEKYARGVESDLLGDLITARYVQWLDELVPVRTRILDVGAGTGAVTRSLARHGHRVTALDVSSAMLSQIPGSKRINRVVGDIRRPRLNLPEHVEPFGAAVSRWVLPHFPDWAEILKNVAPLLLPNAPFIVDFPNAQHYELLHSLTGLDEEVHGYRFGATSDYRYAYQAPDRQAVKAAAELAGFRLVGVRPASFLASNAFIAGQTLLEGAETRKAKKHRADLDRKLAESFPESFSGLLLYCLVRDSESAS